MRAAEDQMPILKIKDVLQNYVDCNIKLQNFEVIIQTQEQNVDMQLSEEQIHSLN